MPSVEVINLSREKTGNIDLDDRFFGADVRASLLHEVILMQLANRRQGTASTKTRGEVRGGGKKPWRQKGTGRARAGSIRSPLWRGGGTTFGPRPRRYTQSFPRRKGRVALYSALSAKVREGALKVVGDLTLTEEKTRAVAALLKGLGLEGKTLFMMNEPSKGIIRAARNIPTLTLQDLRDLNVYDIVRHQNLLIGLQDLQSLQSQFNGRQEEKKKA